MPVIATGNSFIGKRYALAEAKRDISLLNVTL
jgi:hypothetical protein